MKKLCFFTAEAQRRRGNAEKIIKGNELRSLLVFIWLG